MLRKKVINRNVDHMNLRKISLNGPVKERFIQYIYRQSPLYLIYIMHNNIHLMSAPEGNS